jgi:ADP-ribosyl-[dinitrogen reductase] hydrolase
MDLKEKIVSALTSAIVGDALGVPVEFTPRSELSLCSVKNMLGYGRYDQPQGTWSDDSSMILCTMESLCKGYDIENLGETFCKWLFEAHWTPAGFVFDSGITTFMALDRIVTEGVSARESGCGSEDDNGNGSLMRILPAALYFHGEPTEIFLERIHEISSITHSHARSCVGCGIYSLFVRELLFTDDKNKALRQAVAKALEFYNSKPQFKDELSHFMRVLSFEVPTLDESAIGSTGYIVDTLEAAIWCYMRLNSTDEILLAAVNLGLDTDTTGTVAGGLAGLSHGVSAIPEAWLKSIVRKTEIDKLTSDFADAIVNRYNH